MGCICCKEDATEEEREPLIQAEDISSSLSRPRSVRSRPDLDGCKSNSSKKHFYEIHLFSSYEFNRNADRCKPE